MCDEEGYSGRLGCLTLSCPLTFSPFSPPPVFISTCHFHVAFTLFNSSLHNLPTSYPCALHPSIFDKISLCPTPNTRHISAAATGCDLLPGSDRRPVHAGWAAADGVAVALQQRRRVPGRQQRDQPQVAGTNIRHWCSDVLSVHTSTTHGEDRFDIFIWQVAKPTGFLIYYLRS